MTFQPTAAQRRKYAAYSVDRREARRPVSTGTAEDGHELRLFVDFMRIPSVRTFRWRPRIGATANELVVAQRWAERLPAGWWAEFPQQWRRYRLLSSTAWYWHQAVGVVVPPAEEAEEVWAIDDRVLELLSPRMLQLTA